jgi:hypothetical protein
MSTGLYSGVSGLALGTGLYKNVSGLWGGASGLDAGFGGGSPFGGASLYLDFLAGAPLDPRITFSRGSNATLVDSTGKITYAPANLLLYSQGFDDANWTKLNGTTTAANTTVAPDGTTTADTIIEAATTNIFGVRQSASLPAGSTAFSVYVKPNGRNWVQLNCAAGGSGSAFFNISTGAVGTTSGATASISAAANGFYRCTIVVTATAGANTFDLRLASADGVLTYAGNGTSGVFAWGAQLEPVTYQTTPGTYNPTTSAAYYGPRFDYDPVTLAAKGLLIEEQRTNLVTYSEQFDNAAWTKTGSTISANATTAPDGTLTADKLQVANTTSSQKNLGQTVGAISTTYADTVYAKASELSWLVINQYDGSDRRTWFNLSNGTVGTTAAGTTATIEALSNGWYRCRAVRAMGTGSIQLVLNVADADNSAVFVGTVGQGIFLWGAQREAGAFATSYIPTVASQVTRSADVATMTGTNYSSWYNPSEGTLVAEFTFLPRTLSGTAVIAYNGSANGRWSYFSSASARMFDGTNTAIAGSTSIPNAINKTASALSSAGMAISLNGAAPGTSAYVGTFGSQDALNIGSQSGAASINGHIRQIAYYNTRLPDATLQALTA